MATFGEKLTAMRKDLASIVDRLNRDQEFDKATIAQAALVAVAQFYDDDAGWYDDLDWEWNPDAEE